MAFVHLHNHTVFSMLDGATRIQDMVNRAVELGMPAVAITDHGYMYGVPDDKIVHSNELSVFI